MLSHSSRAIILLKRALCNDNNFKFKYQKIVCWLLLNMNFQTQNSSDKNSIAIINVNIYIERIGMIWNQINIHKCKIRINILNIISFDIVNFEVLLNDTIFQFYFENLHQRKEYNISNVDYLNETYQKILNLKTNRKTNWIASTEHETQVKCLFHFTYKYIAARVGVVRVEESVAIAGKTQYTHVKVVCWSANRSRYIYLLNIW